MQIQKSNLINKSSIQITGSKSESNRLLVLQALFDGELGIENLSNSDDTVLMQKALKSKGEIIDIHHAGTAMRFLTAYFAVKNERKVILTGSQRMKERPIGILVDALQELGADISYLENEGFPPLKIRGKNLNKSHVSLKANVSSQFISALLLIAPFLKNGLILELEGKITSIPYIKMTLSLLNEIGIHSSFIDNKITVNSNETKSTRYRFEVESDWSSASYFYSMVALSDVGTEISLKSYKINSLQGDSILADIYKNFGIETDFNTHAICLRKVRAADDTRKIDLDLSNSPDIAQTIAVTAFGLNLSARLTGLHTLKIKETDRLLALENELGKLGADIRVTDNSLELRPSQTLNSNVSIATYNDHRMAMAFAPLALKTPIHIEDANVVSKSYPSFWEDLRAIGFNLK